MTLIVCLWLYHKTNGPLLTATHELDTISSCELGMFNWTIPKHLGSRFRNVTASHWHGRSAIWTCFSNFPIQSLRFPMRLRTKRVHSAWGSLCIIAKGGNLFKIPEEGSLSWEEVRCVALDVGQCDWLVLHVTKEPLTSVILNFGSPKQLSTCSPLAEHLYFSKL